VAIFVINEWLWADASGQNGLAYQRRALEIISKLAVSNHRVVWIEGSAFDEKAWSLCRSRDAIVGSIAKLFVLSVRQNLDRCVILKPHEVAALPDGLAAATKPDDHYLLRALMTVAGALLVTTDAPLREVALNAGLNCLSADEFIEIHL
jgi:hypothetical protein